MKGFGDDVLRCGRFLTLAFATMSASAPARHARCSSRRTALAFAAASRRDRGRGARAGKADATARARRERPARDGDLVGGEIVFREDCPPSRRNDPSPCTTPSPSFICRSAKRSAPAPSRVSRAHRSPSDRRDRDARSTRRVGTRRIEGARRKFQVRPERARGRRLSRPDTSEQGTARQEVQLQRAAKRAIRAPREICAEAHADDHAGDAVERGLFVRQDQRPFASTGMRSTRSPAPKPKSRRAASHRPPRTSVRPTRRRRPATARHRRRNPRARRRRSPSPSSSSVRPPHPALRIETAGAEPFSAER